MSGAGKSTLIDLVPRFHDVTAGRITVDGHDVRDVTQASLRAQIAVVTQETFLFSDSIHYNIAYGRPGATREEVTRAARQAHAEEFIVACPEGYATLVGERGVRLSGGQRQRLAIARAFLKDPPILILDEATSDLDAESEFMVQQALGRSHAGPHGAGHRPPPGHRAQRRPHRGGPRGPHRRGRDHDELMARDGVYRRLTRCRGGVSGQRSTCRRRPETPAKRGRTPTHSWKRLTIGRRQSRPKARGVIFTPIGPWRRLYSLRVDHAHHAAHRLLGEPAGDDVGHAAVLLDVGLEDGVELGIGRQRVLVRLVGAQLGRRGRSKTTRGMTGRPARALT